MSFSITCLFFAVAIDSATKISVIDAVDEESSQNSALSCRSKRATSLDSSLRKLSSGVNDSFKSIEDLIACFQASIVKAPPSIPAAAAQSLDYWGCLFHIDIQYYRRVSVPDWFTPDPT